MRHACWHFCVVTVDWNCGVDTLFVGAMSPLGTPILAKQRASWHLCPGSACSLLITACHYAWSCDELIKDVETDEFWALQAMSQGDHCGQGSLWSCPRLPR